MQPIVIAIVAVVVIAVAWVLLGMFTGIGMPRPPSSRPRPARDREGALAAFAKLEDADGAGVNPACRTQLLRPQTEARGTIVLWHGFTNCPAQFAETAEILCAEGFFVLVARMPRHGLADRLSHQLKDLTAEELVGFADRCIDAAAGLPKPLAVVGLSGGASVAAWTAAARADVDVLVACAPLVEPKSVPLPLGRLLVRLGRFAPAMWIWWDPKVKADLAESPNVYPGFPLRGIVPFLHLTEGLLDGHVTAKGTLTRAVLTTNPNDDAINLDAARDMMAKAFPSHAEEVVELVIDSSLGWGHDFVDQHAAHPGTPDQVADLLLAALGVSQDPTAGGLVSASNRLDAGETT